jgi:hypothetical protein
MKTIKKETITTKFVELMPEEMEPNVLYISKRFCIAKHLCLCGCGNQSVTTLDELITEADKAVTEMPKGYGWVLTEKRGKVSLTPSILNLPCKAHYIITNNVANFV